jgi:8-hydroxy-5-deazaflavin:NADPH oxidoreductase
MKIGIVGAGNVGVGLGRRLAANGHQIVVSFSRTPDKLASAAQMIGRTARVGTPEEAARHGDVILVATPWAAALEIVRKLQSDLVGKILWDVTNPFAPDMTELVIGTSTSAGEQVAAIAPGVRVVKAIPPFAELLHSQSLLIDGRRPGVFVCSDDSAARHVISSLLDEIGVDAVDSGPLKISRFTEPLGMLITNLAYVQGFGTRISTVLIQEPARRDGQN